MGLNLKSFCTAKEAINKTIFQRRQTDCQLSQEKMLSITNHQGNANQNQNEIPPHTCQNGYHQKDNKKQLLARMWRKETPRALLVGMCVGAATGQNNTEVRQKIKNRTAIQSSNSLLDIYPKKTKIPIQKDICTLCSLKHYLL